MTRAVILPTPTTAQGLEQYAQ